MLALHRHLLPHGLRHLCNRLVRRYKPPAPPTPDWLSLANSAAEYAISLTQAYLEHRIPGAPRCLAGKHVLELGPGKDFTPALVMTGYGARVTVVDLYLEKWDPEYHPFFYRQVRQRIVAHFVVDHVDRTPREFRQGQGLGLCGHATALPAR